MDIGSYLRKQGYKGEPKKPAESLWEGPAKTGITFSLLSRFLVCRERFRLLVIEGLKPADCFNHKIEFGQMWHLCEETYHQGDRWEADLAAYANALYSLYPYDKEFIANWHGICATQFPIYLQYWKRHIDQRTRKVLMPERTFDVDYRLPSGRVVKLRGKWDSVDLIGAKGNHGIWLQENKTKGDVKPGQIQKQLTFDLQTMMYLVALDEYRKHLAQCITLSSKDPRWQLLKAPLHGVRYNVVRRPRQYQGKKETQKDFLDRLRGIVEESPEDFFMRWEVRISTADLERFRRECFDPVLEQLWDWWIYIKNCIRENSDWFHDASRHWRHPFGVWNILDEGGSSELDEYLHNGSTVGLTRTDNLFPELEL